MAGNGTAKFVAKFGGDVTGNTIDGLPLLYSPRTFLFNVHRAMTAKRDR